MKNGAVSESSAEKNQRMVKFEGVDGQVIRTPQATWNATRNVIDNYYADYFEVARGITANNGAELKINKRPVPLTLVVSGMHSITVMVATAYNYLNGGGAYRLATYVGPIIGHLKAVRSVMVPQILTAQDPLRAKSEKLDKLQTGLTNLTGQITTLDRDAYAWKALSPKEAYDLAVKCVNEAIRQVMKQVFDAMASSKKPSMASLKDADESEPSEISSGHEEAEGVDENTKRSN